MSECNTHPRKEKMQLQAMIYAIQQYPEINRTKLMKYIFFIDLFTYNKTGETLLEDCYLRLPNGPVPKFGFEYTKPMDADRVEKNEFTMVRVRNTKYPDYYHYQFKLKSGIVADTTFFKEGEKDLLNLTLETVMSRKTTDLSQLTHTYPLWKNYDDGTNIDLKDFKLDDEREDELERFLNTKVYLSPMNVRGFFGNGEETEKIPAPRIIQGFPAHLPVYINKQTGQFIE